MSPAMSIHCSSVSFNNPTMGKEFSSQSERDYYENLPDELVVFIFTKLSSSSSSKEFKFLDDIKSLGRCSNVCKRFNALTCLVPTLSIVHGNISVLFKYCPKILKKFKHIRSLQVTHWSCTQYQMHVQRKPAPIIRWEAAYRPHSYCLTVVAYKKETQYSDNLEEQQSLMLSDDAVNDDYFIDLNRKHVLDMIFLHHMLVYLIKDHKHLQRVVVTDFSDRGRLTLEEHMLIELRNCTSTNLEQVLERDRSGYVINLDVPDVNTRSGFVMNNVCFNIIEWWEKATYDHIHKDDDDKAISSGLPFERRGSEMLKKVLESIMRNPDDVEVNDDKVIVQVLSHIKSKGYIL